MTKELAIMERPWPQLEVYEELTGKGRIEFGVNLPCACGTFRIVICTGFEGTGRCFWCGGQFPEGKRHRHYCSPQCSKEYYRHFFWSDARAWAIHRAGGKCQICGSDGGFLEPTGRYGMGRSGLEVHHWLEPMNGEVRTVSALNVPCNLIVLCHSCHWGPLFHGAKVVVKVQAELIPLPMFPAI